MTEKLKSGWTDGFWIKWKPKQWKEQTFSWHVMQVLQGALIIQQFGPYILNRFLKMVCDQSLSSWDKVFSLQYSKASTRFWIMDCQISIRRPCQLTGNMFHPGKLLFHTLKEISEVVYGFCFSSRTASSFIAAAKHLFDDIFAQQIIQTVPPLFVLAFSVNTKHTLRKLWLVLLEIHFALNHYSCLNYLKEIK